MPNLKTYRITGDTPDNLETSTAGATSYSNLLLQTLHKYRIIKFITMPYYKYPEPRGRITYLAKNLKAYKTKQCFPKTIKQAEIQSPDGQMTHVLKHSFARHFMMNGGNILTLQKILGYSTLRLLS